MDRKMFWNPWIEDWNPWNKGRMVFLWEPWSPVLAWEDRTSCLPGSWSQMEKPELHQWSWKPWPGSVFLRVFPKEVLVLSVCDKPHIITKDGSSWITGICRSGCITGFFIWSHIIHPESFSRKINLEVYSLCKKYCASLFFFLKLSSSTLEISGISIFLFWVENFCQVVSCSWHVLFSSQIFLIVGFLCPPRTFLCPPFSLSTWRATLQIRDTGSRATLTLGELSWLRGMVCF